MFSSSDFGVKIVGNHCMCMLCFLAKQADIWLISLEHVTYVFFRKNANQPVKWAVLYYINWQNGAQLFLVFILSPSSSQASKYQWRIFLLSWSVSLLSLLTNIIVVSSVNIWYSLFTKNWIKPSKIYDGKSLVEILPSTIVTTAGLKNPSSKTGRISINYYCDNKLQHWLTLEVTTS